MNTTHRKSLADLATPAVFVAFAFVLVYGGGCSPVTRWDPETTYPLFIDHENPNSVYGIATVLK